MEDMEKKTEEMAETGEVEMTQRMAERAGWIDTQTYWYLMQLLNLDMDEAKKEFPRDAKILKEVSKAATAILKKHGYKICSPYITTSETGRQYLCTPSNCGCESCSRQDEFMEKERLFSSIENAIALSGLKVLDGDNDCILVRADGTDMDFEIHINRLAR